MFEFRNQSRNMGTKFFLVLMFQRQINLNLLLLLVCVSNKSQNSCIHLGCSPDFIPRYFGHNYNETHKIERKTRESLKFTEMHTGK